jgi:hypothetical protein
MLMVTPLDYYLHNSTFITLPRGMGHMYKTKRKSLPSGEASMVKSAEYSSGLNVAFILQSLH